jgi:glycosyltransferase involved in cell wall biosynthesis
MTAADRHPSSGIAKVVDHLLGALVTARPEWGLTAWHRSDGARPSHLLADAGRGVVHRTATIRGERFLPFDDPWLDLILPLRAAIERAAVIYCPVNTMPKWALSPVVTAIHDLIPLEIPEYRERPEVIAWADQMPARLSRAAQVVVPSSYVKDALLSWLPFLHGRVTVIPWASTLRLGARDRELQPEIRNLLGIPQDADYLLALGAGHPHKNIDRLVRVWAESPGLWQKVWLVVVGLTEQSRMKLRNTADELGHGSRAVLAGVVAEQYLPALMQGALGLCYPSLTEGFGLPVLEAFECGTPVAASNTASVPEVGGDAVLYFDPRSDPSMAQALEQLIGNAGLRSELVRRGRAQLGRFSWRAVAESHAEVFAACAEGRFSIPSAL